MFDADVPFPAETIRIQAEAFAQRHQMPAGPVIRVFEALAEAQWFRPDFPWHTELDSASAWLGPARAIKLFEEEDLDRLARSVALVSYLTDEAVPLFTLDELSSHLTVALDHLDQNTDSLIHCGYPQTSMPAPPWLASRLSCLIPIKDPIMPWGRPDTLMAQHAERGVKRVGRLGQETVIEIDEAGTFGFEYVWSHTQLAPRQPVDYGGGPMALPPAPVNPSTELWVGLYEDAALVGGLSADQGRRAEALRPTVLAARRDVLAVLIDCLTARRQHVWQAVLPVLTRHFYVPDLDFLLDLEERLSEWDGTAEMLYWEGWRFFLPNAAGLSELLELTGHCAEELSVGSYHQTANRLKATIEPQQLTSYYQVIDTPDRAALDAILATHIEAEKGSGEFWEDYKRRVNTAIAEEFSELVSIEIAVKRPYAERFRPLARTFLEWQKEVLEQGGRPIQLEDLPEPTGSGPNLDLPVILNEEEQNEFRRHGFHSRQRISIPAERHNRRNIVRVAGRTVPLTDSEFKQFMLLVLAVIQTETGWISRDSLRYGPGADLEGTFFPSGVEAAVTRLRKSFAPVLEGTVGTEFIEASGTGHVRLSTHAKYLEISREALLDHDAREIRAIAQQLPASEGKS